MGLAIIGPGLALTACSSSPSASSNKASANQLVELGLAEQKAGNTSQAISDFKAAEQKDPNNKFAHYDLGYMYQIQGNAAGASAEYQKTLALDPKFTQAVYNLGVLDETSDPNAAVSYFEQDLQMEPNNAAANFDLGIVLVRQGKTAQGDSYLQTALRLNPALQADLPPGITVPSTTTTTTKP